MNNSLVSIIIPVYNAEKYLTNCIDTILNQTYKNIELILVDDGSTDNSSIICNENAISDHRIRVIHQENSGPSAARNKGIDAAKGKYIQFVDSDDCVEPNMTNKLVELMNNTVQLVLCGYKSIEIDNGNTIIQHNIPLILGIYQKREFIKYFGQLYKTNLIHSPCNKLYTTDIIKNFNIRFKEELNMGEDLLFNLLYIQVCNNIGIINEPLYNYLKFNNNNSLTESFKKNLFQNQQMLFQKVRDFLLNNNCYKEKNKEFVEVTYTNSISNCLSNLFHEDSNFTPNEIKKEIKNIIFDNCVRENINYFKEGNIQKQVIGFWIEKKIPGGIYWFFKIKKVLQNKMRPFFTFLKIVSEKITKNRVNYN